MERSQPRTVDAPERASLTTSQAAAWCGWSEDQFRDEAEASGWCRPIGIRGPRGADLWAWEDVWCLRHTVNRRPVTPRQSGRENQSES